MVVQFNIPTLCSSHFKLTLEQQEEEILYLNLNSPSGIKIATVLLLEQDLSYSSRFVPLSYYLTAEQMEQSEGFTCEETLSGATEERALP